MSEQLEQIKHDIESHEVLSADKISVELIENKGTQQSKLIFNANELPNLNEHNEAIFRRFIIIPFEKTISKEKREEDLIDTRRSNLREQVSRFFIKLIKYICINI